jgi:hypothetical protein
MPLCRNDCGPTCVERGTHVLEGMLGYQGLIGSQPVLLFLNSIPCRDLLLRSSLAFLMHMFG